MNRPITRNQHILADYLLGPLIALAPFLVNFRQDGTPSLLCYIIGAGILGATLATRAELGLVRLVPFRVHLLGDLVGGLFFLVAPWLFGFADDHLARNTFLAVGALILVATSLTRSVDMPDGEMPLIGGPQRPHVLAR